MTEQTEVRRYQELTKIYEYYIRTGKLGAALQVLPRVIAAVTKLTTNATCGEERMKYYANFKRCLDIKKMIEESFGL